MKPWQCWFYSFFTYYSLMDIFHSVIPRKRGFLQKKFSLLFFNLTGCVFLVLGQKKPKKQEVITYDLYLIKSFEEVFTHEERRAYICKICFHKLRCPVDCWKQHDL